MSGIKIKYICPICNREDTFVAQDTGKFLVKCQETTKYCGPYNMPIEEQRHFVVEITMSGTLKETKTHLTLYNLVKDDSK